MGQTIRLNETQLRNIVSESVKKVIKEIGDTPQGRAALTRATDKATYLGRPKQASNFRSYNEKVYGDAFGMGDEISAYSNKIEFLNADGEKTIIFADGSVEIPGSDNTHDLKRFQSYRNRPYIKVSSPKAARKIASWCAEHLREEYNAFYDWHMFALQ